MEVIVMKNEYVSLLNGLIEICKDGEKGFREASEDIDIGYYQILFQEYARQRSQFASALQQEVRKLGGSPDRKGTMAGTIHRGWMNLRSSVNQKTNELIVRECERGEELALKSYKNALKIELPETLRTLIQTQYQMIKHTHGRIKAMEDKPVPAKSM
jgi:uncharacterized protein (TIGR02284 family)